MHTIYIKYMSKKIVCDSCGYHSAVFTQENNQAILNEQAKYLTQGKRRSIEQILNKIVMEWRVDRSVEIITNIKADDSNNKQAESGNTKK